MHRIYKVLMVTDYEDHSEEEVLAISTNKRKVVALVVEASAYLERMKYSDMHVALEIVDDKEIDKRIAYFKSAN